MGRTPPPIAHKRLAVSLGGPTSKILKLNPDAEEKLSDETDLSALSALSALSPRNSSKKTPPSNECDPAASPVGVGTKFLHKVPGYGDWEGVVTKVTVLDGGERQRG